MANIDYEDEGSDIKKCKNCGGKTYDTEIGECSNCYYTEGDDINHDEEFED